VFSRFARYDCVMPEYRAKPGMEDRHGEMTGAITINMILAFPPIIVWCIVAGPWLGVGDSVRLWVAVAMAVLLPIAFLAPSRWIWAHISHFMDRDDFLTRR
jgi:hypothetical protein